jgi:hypothetical protein
MGSTVTTNFSLQKPDYGEPGANWYGMINGALDTIDAAMAKDPLAFCIGSSRDRRYLGGQPVPSTLTTGAPTANVLRALPLATNIKRTLDRIGICVTTLSAGAARLGIYADDGNLYPGNLLLDAGTVDTGGTGVKEITISQALSANTLYWLALIGNAAPTIRTPPYAACFPILGLDAGYGTALGVGWSVALTYGALPAAFTSGGAAIAADPVPAIGVRFSA